MNGNWLAKLRSQIGRGKVSFTNFNNSANRLRRSFSSGYSAVSQLKRVDCYQLIMAANLGVYLLWNGIDYYTMLKHFVLTRENIQRGRLYNFVTYGFSHPNLMPLILNMVPLYFFGKAIEMQ